MTDADDTKRKVDDLGPRRLVTVRETCTGCPALHTEEWEDFGSNDWHDTGTVATCTAIAGGKVITSYWRDDDVAPGWCPWPNGES